MKTRILELAMSRKIATVHDYAKILGIDDDRAELILKGQLELSEPEIQKKLLIIIWYITSLLMSCLKWIRNI